MRPRADRPARSPPSSWRASPCWGPAATTRERRRPSSAATARVVRVVDGDTIHVAARRPATRRVRYIGIDTPESVKPGTPVQCFAKAASAANERLVGGRRVRLRFDAERRDRYGRLLAYVYRADDGAVRQRRARARRLRADADDPAQRALRRPLRGARRATAARARRAGLWRRLLSGSVSVVRGTALDGACGCDRASPSSSGRSSRRRWEERDRARGAAARRPQQRARAAPTRRAPAQARHDALRRCSCSCSSRPPSS